MAEKELFSSQAVPAPPLDFPGGLPPPKVKAGLFHDAGEALRQSSGEEDYRKRLPRQFAMLLQELFVQGTVLAANPLIENALERELRFSVNLREVLKQLLALDLPSSLRNEVLGDIQAKLTLLEQSRVPCAVALPLVDDWMAYMNNAYEGYKALFWKRVKAMAKESPRGAAFLLSYLGQHLRSSVVDTDAEFDLPMIPMLVHSVAEHIRTLESIHPSNDEEQRELDSELRHFRMALMQGLMILPHGSKGERGLRIYKRYFRTWERELASRYGLNLRQLVRETVHGLGPNALPSKAPITVTWAGSEFGQVDRLIDQIREALRRGEDPQPAWEAFAGAYPIDWYQSENDARSMIQSGSDERHQDLEEVYQFLVGPDAKSFSVGEVLVAEVRALVGRLLGSHPGMVFEFAPVPPPEGTPFALKKSSLPFRRLLPIPVLQDPGRRLQRGYEGASVDYHDSEEGLKEKYLAAANERIYRGLTIDDAHTMGSFAQKQGAETIIYNVGVEPGARFTFRRDLDSSDLRFVSYAESQDPDFSYLMGVGYDKTFGFTDVVGSVPGAYLEPFALLSIFADAVRAHGSDPLTERSRFANIVFEFRRHPFLEEMVFWYNSAGEPMATSIFDRSFLYVPYRRRLGQMIEAVAWVIYGPHALQEDITTQVLRILIRNIGFADFVFTFSDTPMGPEILLGQWVTQHPILRRYLIRSDEDQLSDGEDEELLLGIRDLVRTLLHYVDTHFEGSRLTEDEAFRHLLPFAVLQPSRPALLRKVRSAA